MREAEHFRPRNSKCEGPEVKLRERRSKTALRVAGGKQDKEGEGLNFSTLT